MQGGEGGGGEPAPRGLRTAAIVVLGLLCCVTWLLARSNLRYRTIFEQLEMTQLPPPTEMAFAFSAFACSPLGILVGLAIFAVGTLAIERGVLDRKLVHLIVACLMLGLGFGFVSFMGTVVPIRKVREHLSR